MKNNISTKITDFHTINIVNPETDSYGMRKYEFKRAFNTYKYDKYAAYVNGSPIRYIGLSHPERFNKTYRIFNGDKSKIVVNTIEKSTELFNNMTMENLATIYMATLADCNAKCGKKHYPQVIRFEKNRMENLRSIVSDMLNGTYRTGGYIETTIYDSRKYRNIAKVPYRDRVAQWMIAILYQPYFLSMLHPNTHAAINDRGIHTALAQTEYYVRGKKYKYCLKIDIHKYFPSIDRTILKDQIDEDFKDVRVRNILWSIIDDAPDTGIPIGNYLSQFFANRYLTPFDYWLGQSCDFVRYMDDVVIFGNDRYDMIRFFREIEWFLKRNLNLQVKDNWQIFEIAERGIDFVGYRVFPNVTLLRETTYKEMRRKLRRIEKYVRAVYEKTREKPYLCAKDRGTVSSYYGWIRKCSFKVWAGLYHQLFEYILTHTTGLESMIVYDYEISYFGDYIHNIE